MTNKELEKQLKETNEKVDKLVDIVSTLANKAPNKEPAKEAPQAEEKPKLIERRLGGPTDPFPPSYREVVDKVLNSKFKIHLKGFKLTLIPPLEYSDLDPKIYEEEGDLRPKVLTSLADLGEVTTWCETVLKSFSANTQIRIEQDRKNI